MHLCLEFEAVPTAPSRSHRRRMWARVLSTFPWSDSVTRSSCLNSNSTPALFTILCVLSSGPLKRIIESCCKSWSSYFIFCKSSLSPVGKSLYLIRLKHKRDSRVFFFLLNALPWSSRVLCVGHNNLFFNNWLKL